MTYQNAPLSHSVLHLIPLNNLDFLEHFKCVQLAGVLLLDEHHFPKGAFANDGYHLEVLLGDVATGTLLLLLYALLILCLNQLLLLRDLLGGQSAKRHGIKL